MSERPDATSAWLSVPEVARELGLSEKTVRKRIASGVLEAEKVTLAAGGWAWRVAAVDVVAQKTGVERLEAPGSVAEAKRLEAVGTFQPHEGSVEGRDSSAREAHGGVTGAGAEDVPTASNRAAEAVRELPGVELPGVPSVAVSLAEVEMLHEALAGERDQVHFLRGVIEQQQRDAAELRAALREALKISARALPEPGQPQLAAAPPEAQDAPRIDAPAGEAQVLEAGASDPLRAPPPPPPRALLEASASTWERKRGLRAWLLKVLRG